MKVLTIYNEKGGVAKTTLATHIAAGLAIRGKRVLVIDSDGQANATAAFCVDEAPGLYDLLLRDAAWSTHLVQPAAQVFAGEPVLGRLWVLPSNRETPLIPLATNDLFLLHERLDDLKDEIDVVVIDTSPGPSMLQPMVFVATDYVIYPTLCESWALQGVAKTMRNLQGLAGYREQLGKSEAVLLGVQPTLYDERTNAHEYGLSLITDTFKRKAWPALPVRTVYRDATFAQKLLFAYAPPSNDAVEQIWARVALVERGIA